MVLLPPGMQRVGNYYNSSKAEMFRSSFSRPPFIAHSYRNRFLKPKSKAEMKIAAAQKHSEAEKRRRTRINRQYDILRENVSNLSKKDKATVLTETIKQVKELMNKVSKLEEMICLVDVNFSGGKDNASVEKCNDEKGLVKVTLSCEDRAGLMSSIARALGSLKTKVVKAEIVTVGGRTGCVLWVQNPENVSRGVIKSSLHVAMHKPSFKMRRFTSNCG